MRTYRWAGIGANLVFWPALVIFAALRPDYSHLTKAISELGVLGAPNMLLWNLIGFFATGVLVAAAGWSIGRTAERNSAALLLLLAGLAFAATATPGDLSHMASLNTRVHIGASLVSVVSWLSALVVLLLAGGKNWAAIRPAALVGVLAFAAAFALYFLPGISRALVQRVTFGVFLGWYLLVALQPGPAERKA